MKLCIRFLVVATLFAGIIFAKERKNNSRVVVKKVKTDYSFVKDQSHNEDSQLERKRSHKRRRKIRRPIKGLR